MELLLINTGIFAALLIIYSIGIYFVARIFRDNSVMDIAYGPAFLFASAGAVYLTQNFSLLPTIVVGCIAAWSIRLGSRIFRKNLGKPEDARYAKWREEWMQKGRAYFLIRSYLQVNLLQVAIILLVVSPAILAVTFAEYMQDGFLVAGFLVFVFGLLYETVADLQLDAFLKRKRAGTEPATLMQSGLFKFSRRPNYFGETLVWWGLAIMVIPLPFGTIALISPLLITYIVTKVTGPMLENIFLEKYPEEYGEYMRTTSYFIPFFPKK